MPLNRSMPQLNKNSLKALLAAFSLILASHSFASISTPQPFVCDRAPKAGAIYTISNADELVDFSNCVATQKNTEKGVTIELTKDIDMNNISFPPIGYATRTPFEGVFNGQGHIISNLIVSSPSTQGDKNYATGFFNKTGDGAIVKNIIFDQLTIDPKAGDVGGLAGESINTKEISNIRIYGLQLTIDPTYPNKDYDVGGLVGLILTQPTKSTYVTNTHVSVKKISINNHIGFYNVGGLVGEHLCIGQFVEGHCVIRRSSTSGGMTLAGDLNNAGGLVGYDTASIQTSYSVMTIKYDGDQRIGSLGGLVGHGHDVFTSYTLTTMVINYKDADLTCSSNPDHSGYNYYGCVGGLAGVISSIVYDGSTDRGHFSQSFSRATIDFDSNDRALNSGSAQLIGTTADAIITHSYAATKLQVNQQPYYWSRFGLVTNANDSECIDSYWQRTGTDAPLVDFCPNNGLSMSDMKKRWSYKDWSFKYVWNIIEGHYPELQFIYQK